MPPTKFLIKYEDFHTLFNNTLSIECIDNNLSLFNTKLKAKGPKLK